MKTRAAVLYQMEQPAPYADSQPLVVEELELGFDASAGVVHVGGEVGGAELLEELPLGGAGGVAVVDEPDQRPAVVG